MGTAKIITSTYQANSHNIYVNNGAASTDNAGFPTNTTLGQGLQIGGWSQFPAGSTVSSATIREVIFYNKLLNAAERIIVNNYLAAKYSLTLAANDLYDEDTNGDYDYEVAGIGQASAGNANLDGQGGVVRINGSAGLGNGEYYIWGHDNGALTATTTNLPTGLYERLTRIWRGSETGTITSFDVSVDLTGIADVPAANMRLIVDTDNDGSFADETAPGGVITATSVSGNVYFFDNVTALNNNLRFTFASISVPLPIELVDFNAMMQDNRIDLTWSTSSETNNDHFTIERTKDGLVFEVVDEVPGAGNSNERNDYELIDSNPFQGKSYYRLSQTDYDGTTKYFPLVSVEVAPADFSFRIYPNPTTGEFDLDLFYVQDGVSIGVGVFDLFGKEIFSSPLSPENRISNTFHIVLPQGLVPGVYLVKLYYGQQQSFQKVIVR